MCSSCDGSQHDIAKMEANSTAVEDMSFRTHILNTITRLMQSKVM